MQVIDHQTHGRGSATETASVVSASELSVRWGVASLATSVATFLTLAAVRRLAATDPTMAALGPVLWLGGFTAPLIVALKGGAIALILWSLLQLFDVSIGFKRCLATIWTAEIAIAVSSIAPALIAFVRGPRTRADLVFQSGLDLVWSPTSPALSQLSRSVNVFLLIWAGWVFVMLQRDRPDSRVPALAMATAGAALVHVLLPLLTLPL